MAFEDVDWTKMSRRLTLAAHKLLRGKSWEDAEDLAQRAIAQLFDTASYAQWDREKHPDLFDHLAGVVVGLISNRRQLASRRNKSLDDDQWDELPGKAPTNEEALGDRELAAKTVEILGAELRADGDHDALRLLECFEDGVTEAAEQAERTGLPIAQIRNARKRFYRRTEELKRRLTGGHEP